MLRYSPINFLTNRENGGLHLELSSFDFHFYLGLNVFLCFFPEKSTTVCTTRVGDVLGRFHENCLSEQTVSRVQMYVAIVLGLGLMAEPGITATLDFILPFAEVHLCFGENEKTWLGEKKKMTQF